MKTNVVYNEDCLQGMEERIPDDSIDMILADLPYGTTACKWDSIIPLEPLWEQYRRITKDGTAIVLTASQPFTTKLISSNMDWFKYCWYWDKGIPSGMAFAKYQPMREIEEVVVFSAGGGKTKYNPQMIKRDEPIKAGGNKKSNSMPGANGKEYNKTYNEKNPITLIEFKKVRRGSQHPTQKPVKLFKYLIKTYTNKGDIVLDNVIGSGTTAVAAKILDRKYIGFEQDEEYYEIAKERVKEVQKELTG